MKHSPRQRCVGCDAMRRAMAGSPLASASDPFDLISAVAELMQKRGVAVSEQVAVVGQPGFGLPGEDLMRGPFVFNVLDRAELAKWVGEDAHRRDMTAGINGPPPPGRIWCLLAIGTPRRGMVCTLHHDVWPPSEDARTLALMCLVPEDGGPALGHRVAKGGAA